MYYFGYGANKDIEMLEAIIGRRPEGEKAVLKDFELCIQKWEEIPEKARETLKKHWNKDFRSYVIKPSKGKQVSGMLWNITESEHKHIEKWELHNIWYEPVKIKLNGKNAVTEVFNSHYNAYINDKKKMLEVAIKERSKI